MKLLKLTTLGILCTLTCIFAFSGILTAQTCCNENKSKPDDKVESPAIIYEYFPLPGTNRWTDAARWVPSYPGTFLSPGNSAVIHDGGTVIINADVMIDSGLGNEIASPGNALLIGTGVDAGSLRILPMHGFANHGRFDTQDRPFKIDGFFNNFGEARIGGAIIGTFGFSGASNSGTIFFGNAAMAGRYGIGEAGRFDLEDRSTCIITGDLVGHPLGTLAVGYFRPTVGSPTVGKLTVTGSATQLGGTFSFYLKPGSQLPSIGEQYTILAATSREGTFTNTTVQLAPGLFANIYYTLTGAYVRIENNVPTASGVTVSGRVLTAEGRGIRSTVVTLTGPDGVSRNAITGALGAFLFEDVEPGQTYIITVRSRRFAFSPQVLTVSDNIGGIEIIAQQEPLLQKPSRK